MKRREEFLRLPWDDLINSNLLTSGFDAMIRVGDRDPEAPFADLGPAIRRLREAGASDWDLCLVARHAAYEAVFGLLYKLGDPGVDDDHMLFEELLTADPSGLEGRPGSAEAALKPRSGSH